MGNENSNDFSNLQNLDVQKYKKMRPNLSENEIYNFYSMFLSLKPQHGKVPVAKIKNFFQKSQDYNEIKEKFKGQREVDFDQYFLVMSDHLAEKKSTFDNVIYESGTKDVSCLFCPYPTSKENERDSYRVMSKNIH